MQEGQFGQRCNKRRLRTRLWLRQLDSQGNALAVEAETLRLTIEQLARDQADTWSLSRHFSFEGADKLGVFRMWQQPLRFNKALGTEACVIGARIIERKHRRLDRDMGLAGAVAVSDQLIHCGDTTAIPGTHRPRFDRCGQIGREA